MATDLNNTSTPITADGDYTYNTVPGNLYLVKLNWTSGAGTITIKDGQQDAYRNQDDTADLAVSNISTVKAYDVVATGRTITLTAASLASTPIVEPTVINRGAVS